MISYKEKSLEVIELLKKYDNKPVILTTSAGATSLVLIDLLYVPRVTTTMTDGSKEFDLDVKSLIQYE